MEYIAAPLQNLPFDDRRAHDRGRIRADLAAPGKPIGANDLMTAAIARAHDPISITRNTGEFTRVVGPRFEDWAIAHRASSDQFALDTACAIAIEQVSDQAATPEESCTATTRRAGKRAVKRLPRPGALSISRLAWWRSRACLTIASPSPVPPVSRERPRSTR